MHFYYKRRRYRVNILPIFITVILLVLVIWLAVTLFRVIKGDDPTPAQGNSSASATSALPAGGEPASSNTSSIPTDLPEGKTSDWNLILLNPEEENVISKELDFEKTTIDDQPVDSRAAVSYQKMYDAANAEGITLFLRSGYRSISTQEVNYNKNIEAEMAKGNTREEAVALTNKYYTLPGHSEHHTGLAFDIITPEYHKNIYELDERFAKEQAYTWLTAHAAEYGFILRYPKDKEDITNISFEPWHYRYVGVEHAKYIKKNNLCLEEYIALLKSADR